MRAEKHFEELKNTSSSAHLVPRWVNKTMEIWETNLTGKGVCLYFPRWIQQTHMASSSEDSTQGAPSLQNRDKTTKTPVGRNSNTGHGGSKDLREDHRPQQHQPYDLMISPLGDK